MKKQEITLLKHKLRQSEGSEVIDIEKVVKTSIDSVITSVKSELHGIK